MSTREAPYTSILVTGAGGYVGRQLIARLARERDAIRTLVAADIRLPPAAARLPGVEYAEADVRSADLAGLMRHHDTDCVVHLAAIVTPGPETTRELEYAVDVVGTERVLDACAAAGVRKLIYTSSGAAYGYHADNPAWLDEQDPLRGNPEFAYSHHKRLVEEMLARWRQQHPELLQLILRPGVVLGAGARNQITDLFNKPALLGLTGSASPFAVIWDEDLIRIIERGIRQGGTGIFNVAADGTLTLREIARLMGKPFIPLPPALVTAAFWLLHHLHLSQYGPEQVRFLRYRPTLSNRRLKEEFGYVPRKTTREVFQAFIDARASRPRSGTQSQDCEPA